MSDASKMIKNEHFENALIKPVGPLFVTLFWFRLLIKMKYHDDRKNEHISARGAPRKNAIYHFGI